MFVACSTLCFGRHPLDRALRIISELEFGKIDVAIHEPGPHLKPSEVADDPARAAQRIRLGSCLSPAAFSVVIEAPDAADYHRQLKAVCRLARLSAVPLVSVPAAPAGHALEGEVERLAALTQLATAEGVMLTVETLGGTLAENPATAAELCQRVPGLGLALDPSHYIANANPVRSYDLLYPFVRHVRLRDTGRGPDQFQVRVGQGAVEYGRIIAQLSRYHYDRALCVDIRDVPDAPFAIEPEVRKLKYLIESLV